MRNTSNIVLVLCVIQLLITGCGPNLETVKYTTDQSKLAKIAMEARSDDVRRAATEKIVDKALLTEMGMWIKPELTRQVTDQNLLVKIAAEAKNNDVRKAAELKLTNIRLADIVNESIKGDRPRERLRALDKLTDQNLLAKIAMNEYMYNYITLAAIKKLTDQSLLAKVAVESKKLEIRIAAIVNINDQKNLRQWAEKDPRIAIRQASVKRIIDDSFLVQRLPQESAVSVRVAIIETLRGKNALCEIALTAYDQQDRKLALQRLMLVSEDLAAGVIKAHKELADKVKMLSGENDNDKLLTLTLHSEFDVLRAAAASQITNQPMLAKIAMDDKDQNVRRAALEKLADQALLAKVAVESKWLDIRVVAIGRIADQKLLRQLGEKDPRAAVRQASVKQIIDDNFLIQRLPQETSAAVRTTIIETLHDKNYLYETAIKAYYKQDREHAMQRLTQMSEELASCVVKAHKELANKVNLLATETSKDKLLALVLKGEFDVLRVAAAWRLNDQDSLEQAALHGKERSVQRILLWKSFGKDALNRIAIGAEDRAIRLAAMEQAGTKSWDEIFNIATAENASIEETGDALVAISLLMGMRDDVKYGVQQACLIMLRCGDESRSQTMADLLNYYGDKALSEDYRCSGQPDLEAAGRKWVREF